jgi:FkbM family methyltransferase
MKKIFIDGGAHKGEAIEMLLDKRPDMDGCDIHFFEPNPDLINLLESINDERYNIEVHHSAVWVDDRGVDFLESVERWSTLASTVVPSMNEIWGLKLDRDNPKKVPSTNLMTFLEQFNDDDYIVLKLDIEGSEYFVLDDLLRSPQLSKINEIYIEWHDHFFPHFKDLGNDLRNKLSKLDIEVHNDWD